MKKIFGLLLLIIEAVVFFAIHSFAMEFVSAVWYNHLTIVVLQFLFLGVGYVFVTGLALTLLFKKD